VVVFITAYGDAEKAVKAIKMGATDFILKPWQNEKILATINSAISLRRTRLQAQSLKLKQQEISAVLDQPYTDFVGQSPEMYEVFSTIKKVAATDANVLILGKTVPVRSWWPEPCTGTHFARTKCLSVWIWDPSRKPFSKVSCSDMKKGPSQMHTK
jgi:transcriptional regulator with AAA-type ATPase domain